MIDLEELKRQLASATPGPWPWFAYRSLDAGATIQNATGWLFRQSDKGTFADAALVCNLRNLAPELIEELEAAREAIVMLIANAGNLQARQARWGSCSARDDGFLMLYADAARLEQENAGLRVLVERLRGVAGAVAKMRENDTLRTDHAQAFAVAVRDAYSALASYEEAEK